MSEREEVHNIFEPDWELSVWRRKIDDLIALYGEGAIMYCDSGPRGNTKLVVEVRKNDG